MKLFPVVAALALVGTIGKISNADSISDPSSGSMTVDDFFGRFVEDAVESTSSSSSMASSASDSLEFKTFEDFRSALFDEIKAWFESESQAMIDSVGSNSEEYKEFEKKLKSTEHLVAKIKKLPNDESSVIAMEPIMTEFEKKTDQISAFVNGTIEKTRLDYPVKPLLPENLGQAD